MKIAFILFSQDQQLRKHYILNDVAMVPGEIRTKHGDCYKFFTNPPHLSDEEFIQKVNRENPDFSLVLLSDETNKAGLSQSGLPISILDTVTRSMALELARVLTFWIKRLNAVEQIFRPLGNQKALLLPFRNFNDAMLQDLWPTIVQNLGERTFGLAVEIERLLQHLKSREFPKKRGNNHEKYFVDDKQYHYQYGHEKHSKPVISGSGHTFECAISSRVRFGLPYDYERHFNVSLEDNSNLKGRWFINCHGAEHEAASSDHVNMFPNDFIN